MSPSQREIRVATEALRTESGTWTAQSDRMRKIAGKTEELQLTRLEAGLFQIIVDAYRDVIDQVKARAYEGQHSTAHVGATLHQVADTYDREEQENTHRLKNIY